MRNKHVNLSASSMCHDDQQGLIVQDVTKQDFTLAKLGQKLVEFREEVRVGRGFQLIRSEFHLHASALL